MGESNLLHHGPCESCGSSDANAFYDDSHSHCFSCEKTVQDAEVAEKSRPNPAGLLTDLTYRSLDRRGISERICRKWGYGIGKIGDDWVHVANYRDRDGSTVGQKIRYHTRKTFTIRGDIGKAGLYGQWLWRDEGNMVVITEGEIDALSVSEVDGGKWPVVSIPNGAPSAPKAIKKSLEWLEGFRKVIFMFDQDPPGQKAAIACAALLSPGKAFIAHYDAKDPNDLLVAGRHSEIIDAKFSAKVYRPDGILDASAVLERIRQQKAIFPIGNYAVSKLQEMTRGIRPREIVTVCAGAGVGKTNFVREMVYHLSINGLKIGYVALEESVERTGIDLVSCDLNKPLRFSSDPMMEEGFMDSWNRVVENRVFFYDHWGSLEGDHLITKIRYMCRCLEVDVIILDHLSIVVSDMDEGDERKTIDRIMTKLRSLTEETNVSLFCISHLKRPSGTPHEEGGRTSLGQLRGSASIGQLSDIAIGLERNQQDEEFKNRTTLRLLKNRFTGETGVAGFMVYNPLTGRMLETFEVPEGPEESEDF